jgi:predicted nucleotidyltransferase
VSIATILQSLVEDLERVGIPYMVTGSIVSSFHGEPRATRDIDVVIDPDPPALERLVDVVRGRGWYVDRAAARAALAGRSQVNIVDPSSGWKVDLIIRRDRPFSREEFGRRTRAEILGVRVDVATVEDTIVAKLEWARETGSERQLRDVAGMIDAGGAAIDEAYVSRWVDELGLRDLWVRVARGHGS